MKKLLTIAFVLMFALTGMAQSSDLYYPMGAWQTPYDANSNGKNYVLCEIHRRTSRSMSQSNGISCGNLSYEDYHASLTYIGRQLDNNGFATDVFLFEAIDGQGRTSKLGIRKIMGKESPDGIQFVSVTGFLAGKPGFKHMLAPCMYANGMHWHDFTFEQPTYALFMKHLQETADFEDELRRKGDVEDLPLIKGFGDLHQYVNAHRNLTYGKPVYAKCKTSAPVNIRCGADVYETTIEIMKPGVTRYVVDEYNGWCQIVTEMNELGWVKLSDVTLTNTPAYASYSSSGDRPDKLPEKVPDDKQNHKPSFTLTKVDDVPSNVSIPVTTPSKPTVQQSTTSKRKVRGDLGIFDLYGPVKSFTFKNEWGSNTRTFDRNGIWITFDGKPLKQVYPKGMKRDRNGRLVKGVMDADGNGEEYYFNADGRIIKYSYHYFDSTEEDTYTYNADGTLQKKHVVQGGMDAMEPYTEVYQIQTTDKHGNWTKRIVKNGSESSVETRVITYYE